MKGTNHKVNSPFLAALDRFIKVGLTVGDIVQLLPADGPAEVVNTSAHRLDARLLRYRRSDLVSPVGRCGCAQHCWLSNPTTTASGRCSKSHAITFMAKVLCRHRPRPRLPLIPKSSAA